MDLRQLEILQAIAETGSFTACGRKLNVSQSAISRQIALLEEELGEPLFLREELAVRHLIELGHTRIAHIAGTPGRVGAVRQEAYEDVMRAAGLAGRIAVEGGDMSEEGGFRAAVRLLSRAERPTAIFAANDSSCVGALSAATEMGVRMPGDLSLVGFDNSALARLRALWLTSVDGAAREMGQEAGRMLLARISAGVHT